MVMEENFSPASGALKGVEERLAGEGEMHVHVPMHPCHGTHTGPPQMQSCCGAYGMMWEHVEWLGMWECACLKVCVYLESSCIRGLVQGGRVRARTHTCAVSH